MNTIFRHATLDELTTLVDFQLAMALETEGLRLHKETVERGVSAVFEDSNKGQYWIAEKNSQVVGNLLIIPEWSDWRNGSVWWIHSVYITPKYRGQGVFREMYNALKATVEASPQLFGLRLYVDQSNINAQKVYQQLGMTSDHYALFEWLK
ncbi:MAG: GNAT family N-acetyltransferase [Pseudobdellovibrionaceae bacterium]|nr:GNAT family N-acetyltransferase [Bdellovibrionales bacterium]USN47742.1 MAG: GNAT family N-acetyltransferase [Pseudobdellovibrionaceae bacterium]